VNEVKIKLLVVAVCLTALIGCASTDKDMKKYALNSIREGKEIVNEVVKKIYKKIATRNYVVKKGDCLWDIADEQYGDPFVWPAIYKSNRDMIENPDVIEIDQELKIEFGFSNIEIYNFKEKASKYGE